jgi:hypothetical protein
MPYPFGQTMQRIEVFTNDLLLSEYLDIQRLLPLLYHLKLHSPLDLFNRALQIFTIGFHIHQNAHVFNVRLLAEFILHEVHKPFDLPQLLSNGFHLLISFG